MQEVSGVCTPLFLEKDQLKMALRALKVSRPFKKQSPGTNNVHFSHAYLYEFLKWLRFG